MKTRKFTLTTAVAVAMGVAGSATGNIGPAAGTSPDASGLTTEMIESALLTPADREARKGKPLQVAKKTTKKKAPPKRPRKKKAVKR
ncbi:MAG: hypothetical protein ABFS22_05840 [Pseudomonadota bacterium]